MSLRERFGFGSERPGGGFGNSDGVGGFNAGSSGFNSFTKAVDPTRIRTCNGSTDCASGYNCVNGVCIRKDDAAFGFDGVSNPPPSTNSGSGSSSCNDGEKDCEDCGVGKATCGGQSCGITKPSDCCGGTMYTCGHDAVTGDFLGELKIGNKACPQCSPCQDPDRECTDICDSYRKANGVTSPAASCKNVDGSARDCGACEKCFALKCKPWDSAPCWCAPNGQECPDCEVCNRDENSPTYGQCEQKTGECQDCTTCTVTCSCGRQVNCHGCWEHYRNGLAAPAQCRAECYQKYCVDREPLTHTGQPACPPQQDVCKSDPGNECELECYCTTYDTPCGEGPNPAPPGWRRMHEFSGYVTTCVDGEAVSPDSKVIWIDKLCRYDTENEDCEKCDCLCSNDCPDCYYCGPNGECVYDEDCDNPCDQPCNGICCEPGQTCVAAVAWEVVDPCHNAGYVFYAPANVTPVLSHTADITAGEAICHRFHTHCDVLVNGSFAGVHLDCQKGLKRIGPAGFNMCS